MFEIIERRYRILCKIYFLFCLINQIEVNRLDNIVENMNLKMLYIQKRESLIDSLLIQ